MCQKDNQSNPYLILAALKMSYGPYHTSIHFKLFFLKQFLHRFLWFFFITLMVNNSHLSIYEILPGVVLAAGALLGASQNSSVTVD